MFSTSLLVHSDLRSSAQVDAGEAQAAAQPREGDVAKGQLRSNREKKKPKADKNKVKAAPAASPFASMRVPGIHPRGKGGKAGS
jgi:hypothetical protein